MSDFKCDGCGEIIEDLWFSEKEQELYGTLKKEGLCETCLRKKRFNEKHPEKESPEHVGLLVSELEGL